MTYFDVPPRRASLILWGLAGPGVLLAASSIMAAMPLWWPRGAGGIDHLIVPLLVFPAIWAVLFFYVVLTRNVVRAAAVLAGLTALNGGLAMMGAWGIWP
ncbi:MAG: hypothetical protein AAGF36_06160 [Pseudomonadota bacterium]